MKVSVPATRETGTGGLMEQCRQVLELAGAVVLRIPQGTVRSMDSRRVIRLSRPQEVGRPDLLAAWPDLAVWVETKAEHGCVSPLQRAWHERLRRDGFVVLVPRSAEELRAALAGIGRWR